MKALALLLGLAAALPAQAQEVLDWKPREIEAIAQHGPWPPPAVRDPSNRVSGFPAAIALGRSLFSEPRLSGRDAACIACHLPTLDWRDGRKRGVGTVELDRRTPSLWNVGLRKWFGWDGSADSLWMQSLRPIVDSREMAGSAAGTARLLRDDTTLSCGYRNAFGSSPGGSDEKLLVDAAKALAAFQETLITPRTPFDDFRDALVTGDRVAAARYPLPAQRGLRIFVGSGNCAACHFGPAFTNGEFGDVGVPFEMVERRVGDDEVERPAPERQATDIGGAAAHGRSFHRDAVTLDSRMEFRHSDVSLGTRRDASPNS